MADSFDLAPTLTFTEPRTITEVTGIAPNEPRNRVAHVLRNQFATGGGIPSFGVKLIYRLQIE